MTSIFKDMRLAQKTTLSARRTSVMKTAMGVLLTSAVLLLPTVRAEDAAGEKNEPQLSKGEIKAQRQFKMLDFNQDGKLSRKEVAIIPKLAAAFDETDTNKDGYVTYEEVRAYAVKYRAERGLDKKHDAAAAATPAPQVQAPAEHATPSEAASADPESK